MGLLPPDVALGGVNVMKTGGVLQSQWHETVRSGIRQEAHFTRAHLLMNALSAVIGSYGLLANSPAVVIGAMIVAMLLGPIVALSLSLIDSDTRLLRDSLLSLMSGILVVAAVGFVIGLLHRDMPLNHEIMARTAPNFLDLMIALAGGLAGAYATVSFRLSLALVGVAIATALVPPFASAGILMARGDGALALGALQLATVNLIAIQVSASAVFWFTGFRRLTGAWEQPIGLFLRQNLIGVISLSVLGLTLLLNFQRLTARQLFEASTRFTLEREINAIQGSRLVVVRFEQT
ncbi:MAG: DUF389 domain-containing protein, partial [Synechococcaceae cyanobacterium]